MTSALLLLSAGVKVTFIFIFTRANIIDGEQKFTHIVSLHLRNDAVVVSLWVFVGVMACLYVSMSFWVSVGLYGCLWVPMGVYECHGYLWVFMGLYGCL